MIKTILGCLAFSGFYQTALAANYKVQGQSQSVAAPGPAPAAGSTVTVPATSAGAAAATPSTPKVYGVPAASQNQAPKSDNQAQENPALKMLPQLMQGLSSQGGGSDRGSGQGAANSNYFSVGKMEACPSDGSIPASVNSALTEAKAFRNGCRAAQRGDNQKIVISDFTNATPTMWIFDAGGNCLKHTAVTYGNGAGTNVPPMACADGSSHMTPPGFHLTCEHSGDVYKTHNEPGSFRDDALGECSLEGQGSAGRGVVIHRANNPGTASSFGCSGVANNCFDEIKATLGLGALVYNYFGSPPKMKPGCGSSAGMNHTQSCSVENAGQVPAAESAVPGTGQSLLNNATTSK